MFTSFVRQWNGFQTQMFSSTYKLEMKVKIKNQLLNNATLHNCLGVMKLYNIALYKWIEIKSTYTLSRLGRELRADGNSFNSFRFISLKI